MSGKGGGRAVGGRNEEGGRSGEKEEIALYSRIVSAPSSKLYQSVEFTIHAETIITSYLEYYIILKLESYVY